MRVEVSLTRKAPPPEWVADALRAIEHFRHDDNHLRSNGMREEWIESGNPAGVSPHLTGDCAEQHLADMAGTPAPWNEPFRRMIADPKLTKRFNMFIGKGWYGTGGGGAVSVNSKGCQGQQLHAPGYGYPSYYSNEHFGHGQKLNYTWQLRDVRNGDGGL